MTETRGKAGIRMLAPVILAVMLATGCGGPLMVTGKPPWINLDSLVMDSESVTLALRVGNPNDRGIRISGYRLRGRIQEVDLFTTEGNLDVDVSARGLERVVIRVDPESPGMKQLEALRDGQLPNMPFRLDGEIRIDDGRDLDVNYQTYLHPAPGRPGHFR